MSWVTLKGAYALQFILTQTASLSDLVLLLYFSALQTCKDFCDWRIWRFNS